MLATHRIEDFFDRLLIAQTHLEDLPALTDDAFIRRCGVPVSW